MSCFEREVLLEYIDNELDESKALRLNTHLLECRACRKLLEEVKSDRDLALEFLSQLNRREDPISIPEPDLSIQRQKPDSRRILSPTLLKAAAGIALLMGLFLIARIASTPKSRDLNEAELLYLEQIGDMEPNKYWHTGQTLIVLSNDKGEVIQSFSNED